MENETLEFIITAAIVEHCTKLREAANIAYLDLNRLPSAAKNEQVRGQILYWKHYRSVMNHAIETALQRKKDVPNERRNAI